MRLLSIESRPFHKTLYLNASPRGGTESSELPWLRAGVDALPKGLDAVLVASDLQGISPSNGARPGVLLGVALAEELLALDEQGAIPPLNRVGVLLAGDLYSAPAANQRGASGDVREVWLALAECCRWVAGVAGNHDTFGASARDLERLRASPGVHLLDGERAVLDELRIAGVGGIIGNKDKPGRRPPEAYTAVLERAVSDGVDVLVLHEGPDAPAERRDGSELIREAIESLPAPSALVVCGHNHWRAPLATLPNGTQVLNVDARAVLLERHPQG